MGCFIWCWVKKVLVTSRGVFHSTMFNKFGHSSIVSCVRSLEGRVDSLREGCTSGRAGVGRLRSGINSLARGYTSLGSLRRGCGIRYSAIRTLGGRGIRLGGGISRLRDVSSGCSRSIDRFRLGRRGVGATRTRLNTTFLSTHGCSSRVMSTTGIGTSSVSTGTSTRVSRRTIRVDGLATRIGTVSREFGHSVSRLRSDVTTLTGGVSISTGRLSGEGGTPSFIPSMSVGVSSRGGVALRGAMSSGSGGVRSKFGLSSSAIFGFGGRGRKWN